MRNPIRFVFESRIDRLSGGGAECAIRVSMPFNAPAYEVSPHLTQPAAGGILAELDDLGENANSAAFGSAANVFGDTPQLEFRFSEIKYSVEVPRKGMLRS